MMNEQQPSSSKSRFRLPTSFKSFNNKDITTSFLPPLSAKPFLHQDQSAASLQRRPSAPVYPRTQPSLAHRDHPTTHSPTKSNTYLSSTSSIDRLSGGRSPNLHGSNSSLLNTIPLAEAQASRLSASSLDSSKDDLRTAPPQKHSRISTPFLPHSSSINLSPQNNRNVGECTNPEQYTTARIYHPSEIPPQPQQTLTPPDSRTFPLLQSPHSMDCSVDATSPQSEKGDAINHNRLSNDSTVSAKPTLSARKKSGFSSFINSVLTSPRNIKISAPANPIHMIHVGYDNVTGQFTVSDRPDFSNRNINVQPCKIFLSLPHSPMVVTSACPPKLPNDRT